MRSSSSSGKPRGSSLNCSSDQPPRTAIQSPAGVLRTRSVSMSSACRREVTPSNRSSSCSAARIQWAWLSISPGMTERPARSMTRVCGPLSAAMSDVVPTLTTRSPLMASACAMVKRSSTVTILPLTSTVSGACDQTPVGAAATASTSTTARLSHAGMFDPPSGFAASSGALPMSARLHPSLLEGGRGVRRGEKLDQRLGGVRFLRPGHDAAREHGELLDVGGQWADVVDAGEVRELAHLLEADLRLAAGDDAADEHARWCLLELGLDLVGNAQALEQSDHVNAARAGGIADRLGCQ